MSYAYIVVPRGNCWIVSYRCLKVSHDRCFPNAFQFIIHKHLFNLLCVTVAADKVTLIIKHECFSKMHSLLNQIFSVQIWGRLPMFWSCRCLFCSTCKFVTRVSYTCPQNALHLRILTVLDDEYKPWGSVFCNFLKSSNHYKACIPAFCKLLISVSTNRDMTLKLSANQQTKLFSSLTFQFCDRRKTISNFVISMLCVANFLETTPTCQV